MAGPIWLNWPFAGLMVISALYHAGRMVAARQHGRTGGYDIDLTHLVICTAMATMLVMTFGNHLATAWSVVVGLPTLSFILRALRALPSGGARALMQPVQQVPCAPRCCSCWSSRVSRLRHPRGWSRMGWIWRAGP